MNASNREADKRGRAENGEGGGCAVSGLAATRKALGEAKQRATLFRRAETSGLMPPHASRRQVMSARRTQEELELKMGYLLARHHLGTAQAKVTPPPTRQPKRVRQPLGGRSEVDTLTFTSPNTSLLSWPLERPGLSRRNRVHPGRLLRQKMAEGRRSHGDETSDTEEEDQPLALNVILSRRPHARLDRTAPTVLPTVRHRMERAIRAAEDEEERRSSNPTLEDLFTCAWNWVCFRVSVAPSSAIPNLQSASRPSHPYGPSQDELLIVCAVLSGVPHA